MTAAAKVMRSRISHQGVRAGVSSRWRSPNSRRIAGKRCSRGAGGVTRSNSQISGRTTRPIRTHGVAKASDPSVSKPLSLYRAGRS